MNCKYSCCRNAEFSKPVDGNSRIEFKSPHLNHVPYIFLNTQNHLSFIIFLIYFEIPQTKEKNYYHPLLTYKIILYFLFFLKGQIDSFSCPVLDFRVSVMSLLYPFVDCLIF